MSSQTSWSPPPRLWLKCNRLLKLGRPVGEVTLSRWEWWWDERWIWGGRGGGGALNLISTNYPDHGHHGRLPLSRKNAHGRAGNQTRHLMVSSQELWPPSQEAGNVKLYILKCVVWNVYWNTICQQNYVLNSSEGQMFHVATVWYVTILKWKKYVCIGGY